MADLTRTLSSPIVVGVAGDGEKDGALLWAARTAARTGTSLVVVHAGDPESFVTRVAGAEMMAVTAVLEAEEEMQRVLRERVEALAAEPGTVADLVAANPVRYGQSVADTVASVRTWDRATDSQRTFAMVDCGFAPHSSLFGTEELPDGSPRYVVMEVALLLKMADITPPIDDRKLAEALGVQKGARVPLTQVFEMALASGEQATGAGLPPK